ncbi:unnamed protein product, partial [marine sediment metagenome]
DDGDYDLLIGNENGECKAYRNTGSTSSPWEVKPEWDVYDVGQRAVPSFADFDGDGDQDLIIGTESGVSYLFTNAGSITTTYIWSIPFRFGRPTW